MRVTLNFSTKFEERIRKVFSGGVLEKQMEHAILTHVGQTEVNAFKEKLDAQNKMKVQEQATHVATQLGL